MISRINLNALRLIYSCNRKAHQLKVQFLVKKHYGEYVSKYQFSNEKKKIFEQVGYTQFSGTQYTNWMLTRSAHHNHDISHLKRRFLKDRFSIHKLTNIKFLCALATHKTQYTLSTNQKIILLAQLNHVFNILHKEKKYFNQFNGLIMEILEELKDPHDLICLGTFLSSFQFKTWQNVIDSLLVRKSDQEYDQIFGIIQGLNQYKHFINDIQLPSSGVVQSVSNPSATGSQVPYFSSLKNLQFIPVLYRNNVSLLRQYIIHNIYNLKQVRIILNCLSQSRINQSYFWRSVNNWFNIYVKEQIQKKAVDEFFIVSQKAVDKVINDDGMVRPRPILEELTNVAYVIASMIVQGNHTIKETDKKPLKRFLQFAEDLVLYAIENGSRLYVSYLDNYKDKIETYQSELNYQQNVQTNQQIKLNSDFQTSNQQQIQNIKKMQRQYKIVFINPIQIKNQSIIQLLIIMRTCCGYSKDGTIPQQKSKKENQKSQTKPQSQQQPKSQQEKQKSQQEKQKQKQDQQRQNQQKSIFYRPQHLIDVNVLKWLVTRMCKDQMAYNIPQLLEIVKSQDFLKFCNVNLEQLIVEKIKHLRSLEVSLSDLKQLMRYLPLKQFQSLQQILLNFLNRAHPSQILQLTQFIQFQSISLGDQSYPQSYFRKQETQKWLSHLPSYFILLPKTINYHEKYYSFEQNCYFLYYLLKSQVYWQSIIHKGQVEKKFSINYYGEMENLKESVKVASYSRGFKMRMDSYFYKLLNYVDLVEFFQGGGLK